MSAPNRWAEPVLMADAMHVLGKALQSGKLPSEAFPILFAHIGERAIRDAVAGLDGFTDDDFNTWVVLHVPRPAGRGTAEVCVTKSALLAALLPSASAPSTQPTQEGT